MAAKYQHVKSNKRKPRTRSKSINASAYGMVYGSAAALSAVRQKTGNNGIC